MATPVTPDQFVVTTEGLTHIPTGATFTPHFGSPNSGTIYKGQMGNVLENGEEYQPHEVERMMERLWIEYLTENPEAFTQPKASILGWFLEPFQVVDVFYAVHDEEHVMLLYPWPLYADPDILSEALDIAMRYLKLTGQAVQLTKVRHEAAHAMLVAWRAGVRNKIKLANCGIAAVEKGASGEELLSSYSRVG